VCPRIVIVRVCPAELAYKSLKKILKSPRLLRAIKIKALVMIKIIRKSPSQARRSTWPKEANTIASEDK